VARRPLEREQVCLDGGRRTTQLMRDSLDGRPMTITERLCAEGMALEGTPAEARRRFEDAWAASTDDYDAAVAAHFLARHQETPLAALDWNKRALRHATAVTDGRATGFMASLYLNLAAAHADLGEREDAVPALQQAAIHLAGLPPDGYRTFVGMGIRRLAARLEMTDRFGAAI